MLHHTGDPKNPIPVLHGPSGGVQDSSHPNPKHDQYALSPEDLLGTMLRKLRYYVFVLNFWRMGES